MAVGGAFKRLRPAIAEINTAISSEFCVAPLAPPPPAAGAFYPTYHPVRKEAVTAGFRRKKQYHLEVETTLLAIYLTVGFRRKKQYHLEVEPTL